MRDARSVCAPLKNPAASQQPARPCGPTPCQPARMALAADVVEATALRVLQASDCPFDQLGIARGATSEEARASYRSLALILHPDKAAGSARAAAAFVALRAAWERVSAGAPESRAPQGGTSESDEGPTPRRARRRPR